MRRAVYCLGALWTSERSCIWLETGCPEYSALAGILSWPCLAPPAPHARASCNSWCTSSPSHEPQSPCLLQRSEDHQRPVGDGGEERELARENVVRDVECQDGLREAHILFVLELHPPFLDIWISVIIALRFQMSLLCPSNTHSLHLWPWNKVHRLTCWSSRTLNSFIPVEIRSLLLWKGAICQGKKNELYSFPSRLNTLPSLTAATPPPLLNILRIKEENPFP